MTSFAPLTWFAAYTAPRAEKRAEVDLIMRGFEAFNPKVTRWQRHARRKIKTFSPIFVRYVFVGMAEGQSFYDVNRADGVINLVGVTGRPYPIPSAFVHELQHAETRGDFDETRPPPKPAYLEPGAQAKIVTGPFSGFVVTILKASAENRVRALWSLFGRDTELTLDVAHLAAA